MTRRGWILSGLGAALLPAQEPQPKFSSEVKVVSVLATVRNRHGQIVKDLRREDFTIFEDNHLQTIRYFSAQTDLPLTLGLLVDTSGSMRRVLEAERGASFRFLDQLLRVDKDKAFVIHFDREIELLQDLTSSRQRLEVAVASLEVFTPFSYPRPGFPGRRRGGTALYDAVYLAANEVMRKQQGRKALILLSDGEDNASRVNLSRAIESTQMADTLVYCIHIADPYMAQMRGRRPMPGGVDGKKVLKRIAEESGGGFFEGMTNEKSLAKTYRQIEDELRSQYNLGYSSDPPAAVGEYHRIQVKVRDKSLIVQNREGYYAR